MQSMGLRIIYILLIIAFSSAVNAQTSDDTTFLFCLGSNCNYVNKQNEVVFESFNFPPQAEKIRSSGRPLIIGTPGTRTARSTSGIMLENGDTLVRPTFMNIILLTDSLFLGSMDEFYQTYRLYSIKSNQPAMPDTFHSDQFGSRLKPVFKMKGAKDCSFIFSLNESYVPAKNKLLDVGIFLLTDTIFQVFHSHGLNVFKAIDISDMVLQDFGKEFKEKLLEVTKDAVEGSRFRYDSAQHIFRIYKDWYTHDTLLTELNDVVRVEWEYYSISDSMYYFICFDSTDNVGVKNQMDQITVPFSESGISEVIKIDSLTEYLIATAPDNKIGIIDYKNIEILPKKYKKIEVKKYWDENVFVCKGTNDQYGILNLNGKEVLPFHFYEISPFGNLFITLDNQYANKCVRNRDKIIFYSQNFNYNVIRQSKGYFHIDISNISFPGLPTQSLSFISDESGKHFLPSKIENQLQDQLIY
jgi:hypothetical protein